MGRSWLAPAAVIAALSAVCFLLLVWIPADRKIPGGVPLQSPAAGRQIPTLSPGTVLEKELRSGADHLYLIPLQAGDYLHAVVDQRGVDVVVSLTGPAGGPLLEIDSPNGTAGPEPLHLLARTPGGHLLRVRALEEGAAGRYGLRIEALRPATGRDRVRAAAVEAMARGAFESALRHWRALGDRREQAVALRRIGQASYEKGDARVARGAFEESLEIYRNLGDRQAQAPLLNDLGAVYSALSRPDLAEGTFLRARDIARRVENRVAEGVALHNLGTLYDSGAELGRSLDVYAEALVVWRELGDRSREAGTLQSLGAVHSLLGRTPESLDLLRQALRLRRATGDRRGEAETLMQMGWTHYLAGDLPAALGFYDQSLPLFRQQEDRLGEAGVLDRRGTALAKLGRLEEARASYQGALEILQRTGQPVDRAHTLANLGWLHESHGDPVAALSVLERALPLFRRAGDRHAEAHTLLGIARVERRRGDLGRALSRAEESLRIVESLRADAPLQALRTSYLASRHGYYELAVDLLTQAGRHARAWEMAERARARSLLESVGPGARAIDEDLRPLLRKGTLRSRLRSGAGPAVEPLSLGEVQRRVLDGDTLLLQYSLGEERSFLWVVGSDFLASHTLPGRREIEDLARRVHDLWSRSHKRSVQGQAELAAAALSDAVLGPAAGRLEGKRLVVVPDGALHYIPFAALPAVSRDGARRPLLADHEVIHLPSASVLARLRRERGRRPRPSNLVAVVADPVFQQDDARVRRWMIPAVTLASASTATRASDLERSAGDLGIDGFARLPHTRREAEEILRWTPSGDGLPLLDFEARRETVLDGRLRDYRIVHFATHGLLNAGRPELSGLVLSLVDERGRPRDGFLRVHEIPGLGLSADLVVLSACRTALGKEVRGEGLLGLTQGFLQAGAGRVVVTLWNVDDEATSELMSRFYRGMLRDRLPPARALREAQLSVARERRWEVPYYWAGFIVQGDWL